MKCFQIQQNFHYRNIQINPNSIQILNKSSKDFQSINVQFFNYKQNNIENLKILIILYK